MATEKKQLSTDEIEKWVEDAQHESDIMAYENWKLEEAGKGRVELSIQMAKKSMDETYEKHLKECKEIIDLSDKYYNLEMQYDNDNVQCLYSRLSEIALTVYDMYFLIMSAKYKTAKILLRKWLELIVLSIYFDTVETDEKKKQMWINVDNMKYLSFNKKLHKVSDNADSIATTYEKLSLYAHNEGKRWNFTDGFYDKKEFNDIYSEITQIQLEIEKMIEKNYKGEVRFN